MSRPELDLLWDRYLSGDPLTPAEERRLVEAFLGDPEFRKAVVEDEALDGWLSSMGQPGPDARSFVDSLIYRLGVEQDGRGFLERLRRGRRSTRVSARRSGPQGNRTFWAAALAAAAVLVAVTAVLKTRLPGPQETFPREDPSARSADAKKGSAPDRKSHAPRPAGEERGADPKPIDPKPERAAPAAEPPVKKVGAPEERPKSQIEDEPRPSTAKSDDKDKAPKPPEATPPAGPAPTPSGGEKSKLAVAMLEEIGGKVYRLAEAREAPATPGGAILSGDGLKLVGEGSRARLKYPDGTSVELLGDTEVRNLDLKAGKRMLVAHGSLWADVALQPRREPMILETPHAEATVLGTTLRIVVDPDPKKGTRLEVEAGRVRLKNLAGKTTDVASGHYAVAAVGLELTARKLSQNLLASPGFERSAQGWKSVKLQVPTPPLQRTAADFIPDPYVLRVLVSTPSRSGEKALAIPAVGDRRVCQEVLIDAGAVYDVEFWAKTRDLSTGGAGVSLIWYEDSNRNRSILGSAFTEFAGTREWTRISAVVQAPPGVTTACFHIGPASGPNDRGTAWFDDFIFRKRE